MDPIQARIQTNPQSVTLKANPEPTEVLTRRPKVTITEKPDNFLLEVVIMCMLFTLPFFIIVFGIRAEMGNRVVLQEYYNLPISKCHVIPNNNYTITPLVFNETLLYWPAQLHMTAMVHSKPGPNEHLDISPVRYAFPTPMEVEFKCPGGSPYRDKGPGRCDYMVGDVIGKYHEFQRLDTFPCYIKDGLVIGTDYEFNNYLIPAYNTVYWCTIIIDTLLTMIVIAFTWIIYIASPMKQLQRGSS